MKQLLFAAAAAWLAMPGAAQAQTLPLNTGYDHANLALYAVGAQDQYWIKIASYEPPATGTTTVAVAAAWVYDGLAPWLAPSSIATVPPIGSRWIGPRASRNSSAGTSLSNPSYSIYRKCFCLLQGFQTPRIQLQVRADDLVHVWLNNVTRTLISPSLGNFSSGAVLTNTNTNPGLAVGRNCIYVLVEDIAGVTGFNLAGTVSTSSGGMMPLPAAGVDGSFAPCQCPAPTSTPPSTAHLDDDREVVRAIVAFAEARRLSALARLPRRGGADSSLGAGQ